MKSKGKPHNRSDNPLDDELLSRLSSAVEKMGAALTQTKKAFANDTGWSVAKAAWLVVDQQINEIASLSDRMIKFKDTIYQRSESEFLEIETNVRNELAAIGLRVDGQWPKLFVERAIAVEFFEQTRSASVGDAKVEIATVSSLVSLIRMQVQELFPKNFSADQFLAKLEEAYDSVKRQSAQVPIFDVYRSYVVLSQKPKFWKDARGSAFNGISLEQFRARLSKVLEASLSRDTPLNGRRSIRLFPPLDPKDAIFLYLPSESRFGFVGRIEFCSNDSTS